MEGVSENGSVTKPSIPKYANNNLDASILVDSQKGVGSFCQLSQSFGLDKNKRMGMPPSHPHIPQPRFVGSQTGLQTGSLNSRSLPQSPNFVNDFSPLAYSLPDPIQLDPVLAENSMEDRVIGGCQGMSLTPPVTGGNTAFRVNNGLPPRRGHRRSMSDSVPLGFYSMIQSSPQLIPIGSADQSGKNSIGTSNSVMLVKHEGGKAEVVGEGKSEGEVADDLISAYMNLSNMDILSGNEDKELDSRGSGTKTNGNESSDNEVESRLQGRKEGLKRGASEDITTVPRHRRSLSMDSYVESLRFDVESLKLPPVGTQVDQQSPSNSVDGKSAKFSREIGNSEFSETELKKIMANEKLAEIAMSDPKRVKRILANRQSAARSKERKMRYISELEQKVQTLQTEATTLSAQVTALQRDSASLTSQNSELRFRVEAMEQQAQLKDALNEALVAEIQRLNLAAVELSGNPSQQFPDNQMFLQPPEQSPQHNMYHQQQHAHQTRSSEHNNALHSWKQNGEVASK